MEIAHENNVSVRKIKTSTIEICMDPERFPLVQKIHADKIDGKPGKCPRKGGPYIFMRRK